MINFVLISSLILSGNLFAFDSFYTSIKSEDCKVIEQSDEYDYGIEDCGVVNGLKVQVAYGDARAHLELVDAQDKNYVVTPEYGYESGGFPYLPSDKIEWRVEKSGSLKPFALIARFAVTDVETNKALSYLTIWDLNKMCEVGIIPANFAEANANARQVADDILTSNISCSK